MNIQYERVDVQTEDEPRIKGWVQTRHSFKEAADWLAGRKGIIPTNQEVAYPLQPMYRYSRIEKT